MLMFYVLIVLFTMDDGSIEAMRTFQSFNSPVACLMKAHDENKTTRQRTYLCVPSDRADMLSGQSLVEADIGKAKTSQ